MRILLSASLALLLAAAPALAHGGQYKGPSDAGGPGGDQGGTVAPPTNPGGATAPGPGAPAASGAATGGARTAGGRNVRGGSNRRGATTKAGALDEGKGFDIWEFWWENNKDRFLDLKGRLVKTSNVSGSPGALTGRGRKVTANASRRPSRTEINTEVIPALLDLLQSEDDQDILDSAILALGRTAEEDMADQILDAAKALLGHRQLSVQSSATLTMGVLGTPKAVGLLQDLLQDSTNGRRLTGGGEIHWLVRAFAGLSLGLIADETSVRSLIDVTRRLPDSDKDIKVCSIVGLGLIGQDHPLAGDVRAFLAELLDDRRLDPLIQSYVPTSMGKLGGHDQVPTLLEKFTDRDTDNSVLQSCAIALGLLATMDDADAVEALIDYVEEGRDVQTRHFSIISLGQIGARDETPDADEDRAKRHERLVDLLATEIQGKGKSQTHRSWGALAGALYGRVQLEQGAIFVDRIQAAYEKEKDPSYKAAYAVSLGLLNAQGAAEQIFEDFNEKKENDFRGYAGVALGFLQYDQAADALRSLTQNRATVPTLRLQAATGLGLMSDTQAVDTLINTLQNAETLGVSSAVAKALGLIGDRNSIGPLRSIAQDESVQKITRAFACVALGIVGEKTDLPWNAQISENNNYRAEVPSIKEVLDIL